MKKNFLGTGFLLMRRFFISIHSLVDIRPINPHGQWLLIVALCATCCVPVPCSAQSENTPPAAKGASSPDRPAETASDEQPAPSGERQTISAEPQTASPASAAAQPTPSAGIAELPSRYRISQMCLAGQLDSKSCKYHWRGLLLQEFFHLSTEQTWNVATNSHIQDNIHYFWYFKGWFDAVKGFRWGRWSDDNGFEDDYIGHGMMGAISNFIYVQNDPRSMTLTFSNSRTYWKSRLRATAWAALYSLQWKIGPLSEASIGNQGISYYYDKDAGKVTNGTGTETLVTTPVVGLIWRVGEDNIDLRIITKIEKRTENPWVLFPISFLTPCRSFANLMRFKSPWYRDDRPVRHRAALVAINPQTQHVSQIPTPR